MRQRKAKDLEKRLEECSQFIIELPDKADWESLFSTSSTASPNGAGDPDMYLEIGCGKGQFIIKKAADNPDKRFIAIEGQETVILRAAEKARAVAGEIPWPENVGGEERLDSIREQLENTRGQLGNLIFTSCFVEKMNELFKENQLAGIYLNFSDPWPKARHAKRRLTYRERLRDYAWAIKPGGFIEIKTDNEGLFEFTLEEIEACREAGIRQIEMTRDLHGCGTREGEGSGQADNCDEAGENGAYDLPKYESAKTTTEYEDKFSGRGKNINYVKVIIDK